ncbi:MULTISPECIES: hypothetical protein [unclassified Microcoleus]|uniref:hypothetical protein n=1 Tax=unclassified Microcoleus TaxID=2642155 RepID=UPI002FCF451D
MQRQLSIFDTLQPLDTAESKVKAGDYVKLRRKSPSAAYWKKGEIVQIEAVHPTNGSVKFWDERAQTWGYLHPDDFAKTLPPIESVPPRAIALVAESEPIPDVAESPAPPDVAESKPAVGEIDSATTEPIALVAESGAALDSATTEPIAIVAESEPALGEIDSATKSVSTYRPKGSARGGEYFRFVYRAGTKTKSVHIPGGNTGSILAQSRAAEVMELSAAGVPALEICEHIKRWSTRRHLET